MVRRVGADCCYGQGCFWMLTTRYCRGLPTAKPELALPAKTVDSLDLPFAKTLIVASLISPALPLVPIARAGVIAARARRIYSNIYNSDTIP